MTIFLHLVSIHAKLTNNFFEEVDCLSFYKPLQAIVRLLTTRHRNSLCLILRQGDTILKMAVITFD